MNPREFQMVYNARREFISSYFYDANNLGGTRLENEISFNVGDKAWMTGSCYLDDEELKILIPVIIEGMVPNDQTLNIESDDVKVKPLVTVKCNWGEYPDPDDYEIPRIDLLPHNIIKQ